MKTICKDILTALFMGMVLPGILLNFAVMLLDAQGQVPQVTLPQETAAEGSGHTMYLRKKDGTIMEQDLDVYLTGVVLAEMPASFEEEALKAQSVAARTYTRRAWETGGKHGDGSVCTESVCCQAYLTEEAYLAKGGTQEAIEKIRSAVYATAGVVLTYEGELIEATYFSCSGGSTEDAVAVWGKDYPYLQSVGSPGEEKAEYFTDTVSFSVKEFQEKTGIALQGAPESWFGPVTYTEGGGVAAMTIGSQEYAGTYLRSALGLRSTAFSIEEVQDTSITITTRGYGHRVGMSQYGADAMALSGSTYEEILSHYYPGTVLTQLQP